MENIYFVYLNESYQCKFKGEVNGSLWKATSSHQDRLSQLQAALPGSTRHGKHGVAKVNTFTYIYSLYTLKFQLKTFEQYLNRYYDTFWLPHRVNTLRRTCKWVSASAKMSWRVQSCNNTMNLFDPVIVQEKNNCCVRLDRQVSLCSGGRSFGTVYIECLDSGLA